MTYKELAHELKNVTNAYTFSIEMMTSLASNIITSKEFNKLTNALEVHCYGNDIICTHLFDESKIMEL